MNPYGVGQSGKKAELRTGTCPCCNVKFEDAAPHPKYIGRCPRCQLHDRTTPSGEIRMLKDHARQYLAIQNAAMNRVRETMAERANMQERMIAALRSRDRWQRIVDTIEESHIQDHDGRCICGRPDCDIPELIRTAEKEAFRQELIHDHEYMSDWQEQWERMRRYRERYATKKHNPGER